MKTLGQVAYEAYCVAVNGLSYSGVTLPEWEGSTDNIRNAWEVAATAVVVTQRKHTAAVHKAAAVKNKERKRVK